MLLQFQGVYPTKNRIKSSSIFPLVSYFLVHKTFKWYHYCNLFISLAGVHADLYQFIHLTQILPFFSTSSLYANTNQSEFYKSKSKMAFTCSNISSIVILSVAYCRINFPLKISCMTSIQLQFIHIPVLTTY